MTTLSNNIPIVKSKYNVSFGADPISLITAVAKGGDYIYKGYGMKQKGQMLDGIYRIFESPYSHSEDSVAHALSATSKIKYQNETLTDLVTLLINPFKDVSDCYELALRDNDVLARPGDTLNHHKHAKMDFLESGLTNTTSGAANYLSYHAIDRIHELPDSAYRQFKGQLLEKFLYSEKFRSSVGDGEAVNGQIINYLAGLDSSTYRSIVSNNKSKIIRDINIDDASWGDDTAQALETIQEKFPFLRR